MTIADIAGEAGSCMPCRGTGRVVSGLGGEPHQVTCPWCQGSGQRIPGIDAQEHPAEAGAPVEAPSDPGPSADPPA